MRSILWEFELVSKPTYENQDLAQDDECVSLKAHGRVLKYRLGLDPVYQVHWTRSDGDIVIISTGPVLLDTGSKPGPTSIMCVV